MEWIKGISPIAFPGLDIFIDPPSGVKIGTLSINFYGVLIALGLILAVVYAWKRAKQFGINEDHLTDGVLWVAPFAIICARLYYCAFRWEEGGYAEDPLSILCIWKGGLAIYGAVIGAGIGTVIHCKIKKMNLAAVLDLVALGFLIGQAIGRWGNFFNREAFGAETDNILRMGLMLDANRESIGEYLYFHPTFFYESVWNLVGFVGLHLLSKTRKYDGQIALSYVVWYGLGRALIEGLRTDSLYWGTFRVSQVLAAASCIIAAVVMIVIALRKPDPANLCVNRMAALAEGEEEEEDEEDEEEESEEETSEEVEESEEETTEE